MKKKLSFVMAVLLVMAWYVTLSSWLGNESRYEELVAEAQRLEAKGLYLDAIDQYEKAAQIKGNTLELAEYTAEAYLAMGNYKEYQKQLKTILDTYGPVEADVRRLVSFHEEYSSQGTLISCVAQLYEQYPDSETIKAYYDSLKGIYEERYLSLDYIGDFRGDYAVYESDGKKGLLNEDGKMVVEAVYDELIYDGKDKNGISAKDGEDWFYISSEGYKVKEPDSPCEYLGPVSDKRIVARRNGKYGYLDSNMNVKTEFIYDDATAIHEGVGAVRQGEKWALVNKKGELLTEYIYDDVAVNSAGICSLNKVIGVCQNGSWYLINTEGERISEESYQDMKAFESGQPCAVCLQNRWGYADLEGRLVIECVYEDAESFANDYAPVCQDGLWGYIDQEDRQTVACTFAGAGHFTKNGVAPVAHGDTWTLIQLTIKE